MSEKKLQDDWFDNLFGLLGRHLIEHARKQKTRECFDDETLQKFLNKELPKEKRREVKKHVFKCLHCLFRLIEKAEEVIKERKMSSAPLDIEFSSNSINILREPLSLYPAGVVPVAVRGGKKIYRRKSLTRIWHLGDIQIRITFEKKGKNINFLIRMLKNKKPVLNEIIQLGRGKRSTDRQGRVKFEIPLRKKQVCIYLKIPSLGRKLRINLKGKNY